MEETLIIVLYKHRLFGWKFNSFVAQQISPENFQLLGAPDKSFIGKISLEEKELIALIDQTSDRSLMRNYSREKTTVDFLNKVTEDNIKKMIRPAIEIYAAKIVQLLISMNYPLYLRDDLNSKLISDAKKIEILPHVESPVFNFEKNEEGLRYFITLPTVNGDISLRGKEQVILAEKPTLIVLENKLYRMEIEAKKLTPFYKKEFIFVPPFSEKTYIKDFVLKTFFRYHVNVKGIDVVQVEPQIKAVLSVEKVWNGRLSAVLSFYYGEDWINPALSKVKEIWYEKNDSGYTIYWYERNTEYEDRMIKMLTSNGLELTDGCYLFLDRYSHAADYGYNYDLGLVEWINSHQDVLKDFEVIQNVDEPYYIGNVRLESSFDMDIDWFEVKINVVLGNYTVPFSRFRKNILTGDRSYTLPDGSLFILPEEWFSQYNELAMHAEEHEENLRLKKIHFNLLDTIKLKNNKRINKILSHEKVQIPVSLEKILRPYQKEGFYWLTHLYQNHFGGCLADDMGLGKTLQTITLLQYLYAGSMSKKATNNKAQLSLFEEFESDLPASLIVVPTSLLHNWHNELSRFAPDLKIYIYAGAGRLRTKDIGKIFDHYQVIITSYGVVRNDIDFLKTYEFHHLILDESQYIKNADSQTYKAVKGLFSSYRLTLTGTPIENSLSDLWSQLNFLNEGLLGTYDFFQKSYIRPIVKEENKERELALQRIIQPFLLRRTKEEVTPELPPLTEQIIYCDMSETQNDIYQKEKNILRNRLFELTNESLEKNKFYALQGLTKLRLLANHPSLSLTDYQGDSGKYEQIIMFFETLKSEGHKVLIFSSFVKHLKLLAKEFDKQSWKYAMLTGQTKNRESEIRKFVENKDINCFFISLKAGGTGLNLTEADYVFIIDPWWNPAVEKQALSRAHRIGQQKSVMVYRFISSSTIEENIIRLQQKKRELSETFITSDNPLDVLTVEEIRKLL